MRVLIVDDERLARAELRRLLSAHPDIEIVAEAANAAEAISQFAAWAPEVAFVDIHMPGASGLQLAADLEGRCRVVFCTAYDQYAIDAFGLAAVDYLLKPVEADRLARCLLRLSTVTAGAPPTCLPLDHPLLLKFGSKEKFVRLRDIDRFQTVGNHAAVYCCEGLAFVLSPLSRIEERLDPANFIRVSRGEILRIDAIGLLEPEADGGLVARMRDGTPIRVSRRRAQSLRQRLGRLGV